MELSSFKLNRYFAKYEAISEYFLGNSDGESLTVEDILVLEPEAHTLFEKLWLGYTETQGAPPLRQEICRSPGRHVRDGMARG
jgi:hypothetical protein